ncbi:MAG: FkbM family methyltransferase, partial [Phycisphaerales bacterium]
MRGLLAPLSRRIIYHSGLKSGLGRLASRLDHLLPHVEERKLDIRLPDGLSIRIDPREFVGRHLFWAADYDPKIREVLIENIRPGDRVLDIGAHCGTYGLRAARATGPTGRVVMVEPNPSLAADIAWCIERNGMRNIQVEECAVGGSDGIAELHFSGAESVTASLLPVTVGGSIANRSIEVRVRTIASIMHSSGMESLDVIKIDAEGLDDLIVGQVVGLRDLPRCIVFELHVAPDDDVWNSRTVSRLVAAGFEVRAIAKSFLGLRLLGRGEPA